MPPRMPPNQFQRRGAMPPQRGFPPQQGIRSGEFNDTLKKLKEMSK